MEETNEKIVSMIIVAVLLVSVAGCGVEEEKVVNIYTDRHYDTDQDLYDKFTEQTGIVVNVVKADSDELLERLKAEGENTEADLLVTSDVGRLFRAGEMDLIKAFNSDVVESNVPEHLRATDDLWTALTVRARVITYALDRVDPSTLSTYEALTEPEWEGKVLARSSSHIYNQSLLASFIALNGEEAAKEWAQGLVANMARTPEGNDRDQMKAVVAGEGDVAIVNTYYLGKLLNSSDEVEVEVGKQIGVFFPNQETNGTHINISGAALTKYGTNDEAAIELLEFLTGSEAQNDYASANYEYPVNEAVAPSDLLKSFGELKIQNIALSLLGEYNDKAVKIFNEVGWQ
ncbi:Fe(3+) ABC transporter substrate-binding protein [Petrocella sp. FN5]|uniref:Fe(3+) ABC transporter substrate-binding protein n=1 Tax=Petrocella sp. FN5 TaxID=3032002 RepID=UPI0023D9D45F|nr:Fe(3+) ABC transporter substrate-binding protein [Petrocella sp. FN5]MDF1616932.1 Fe(3+) ABC transporter substrate-binding protein [Petrocella sp. FN5]